VREYKSATVRGFSGAGVRCGGACPGFPGDHAVGQDGDCRRTMGFGGEAFKSNLADPGSLEMLQ
jgi:hypothetical protein